MITDVDWIPTLNLGKLEGYMQSPDHGLNFITYKMLFFKLFHFLIGEPFVDNDIDSTSVDET